MKRLLASILFGIIVLPAIAGGGKATLEVAEDLYSRLMFTRAAEYYQKYLEKNGEDIYAWNKLADCYHMTNDYDNLQATLGQMVEHDSAEAYPDIYLSYAEVLQIKGNCGEAQPWFEKYLGRFPDDRRASNQLDRCLGNAGLVGETDGVARYGVTNMPFNTADFEYAPNILNKTLVYTSTSADNNASKKVFGWTGGAYSDLKQYERDSLEVFIFFNEMEKLNTTYNDGPFAVDPVTRDFYYTRNNFDPDKTFKKKGINAFNYMNLKIYVAEQHLGKVGAVSEFPFNSADYNTGHPAFSPDGKYLVFVSDKPEDNIGGRDLYYTVRNDSTGWGEPVLLSDGINTEGDELFPYFHEDGSLYFSSDGLGGYGGLDIYRAEVDFEQNALVSLHRMEDDINSTYDDFGITFKNARDGYFSSDRPGGMGKDDIYAFEDLTILLRGLVVNNENGKPLPGSDFRVSEGGNVVIEGVTDDAARFETYVYRDRLYDLLADEDYFIESGSEVSTRGIKGSKPIEVTLRLDPVKYTVKTVNSETGAIIAGVKVDVAFDCGADATTVITKSTGSHSLPVHKACGYSFKAKADGFLAANLDWTSPAEDSHQEVVIALEPIHYRPITLRNIYYDFDKDNLRLNESADDLEKLLGFVTDNPELTIQINSHTDARGSKAYNEDLAQRRAQSVVRWLLDRGVPKDRLKAVGYGENQPVNKCVDGVKCSEEEHQLNRRTEFQVVNPDGSTKIGSDARDDIKTDPCKNCPF